MWRRTFRTRNNPFISASKISYFFSSMGRFLAPRTRRRWDKKSFSSDFFKKKAPIKWRSSKKISSPKPRFKRIHFWLFIFLLLGTAMIGTLIFFDHHLKKPLMFLAKVQIKQMTTESINEAIRSQLLRSVDSNKMIHWNKSGNGKIHGFEINYKQQMEVTAKATTIVENLLKEKQNIAEQIPIGHALESPLLSAIGPSISFKFYPISAVNVEIKTEQHERGINMLVVEVYAHIRSEMAIVIPFDKESEIVETKIPLSYALIVGDVPTYYYDGKGNPVGNGAAQAPPIALPGKPHSAK